VSPARFAHWPRWAAAGLLALTLAVTVVSLVQPRHPPPRLQAGDHSDIQLYDQVIATERAGAPYEVAAVQTYRAAGSPVRPFIAVRPPLLLSLVSRLPNARIADGLLAALAWGVIGAWALRLRRESQSLIWLAGVPLVVFTGVEATMPMARLGVLHEAWAGLLIALSLALRTDRRFLAAVLVGLLAGLIRELAMPYLLVMAALALHEHRRAEAGAFAAALAISLLALAWHGWQVSLLTGPADVASPGWLGLGGWPFVVSTARWNFIALRLGAWVGAVIAPLALLGAGGRDDHLGRRLFVLLAGYEAGFMVFGRPENFYWGLITAPILAVGLCFAPRALGDLARAARGRHSATSAA
jgi:hypothetical protein